MNPLKCFFSAILATCSLALAEDYAISPLSDDHTHALNQVEESEVLATVSFLASDEMAGRNTPSKELDIAAAYVAARFRGAGLEGLGPEGSYFQTTVLTQYAAPKGNAEISVAGQSLKPWGILLGGEKDCSVTGAAVSDKDLEAVAGRIVVIDEIPLPPQAAENPGMLAVAYARRVTSIAGKGAAAILVRTSPDSFLPEATELLKQTPLSFPTQFLVACPVILIPADSTIEGEVTVKAPSRVVVETPVRNVIGVLRGSDPEIAKQAIIVSAHLDHIGLLTGDRQGDVINNGADDNATGVTAVVTLADAFASLPTPPKRSIIFMTFWGEEKGLLGSKYYADNPLWPLDQTIANVNLEMIGRPEENAEGKSWGTGWTRSSLSDQMAAGALRAGVTIFHREDVSEMLYTRSDNFAFVQKGVIAHSYSAGSLHSDYHQPSDEVSKLNVPHMTLIIRGLFAGIQPIADAELTPRKTQNSDSR